MYCQLALRPKLARQYSWSPQPPIWPLSRNRWPRLSSVPPGSVSASWLAPVACSAVRSSRAHPTTYSSRRTRSTSPSLATAGRLAPDSVRSYAQGRIALWSKDGRIQRLEDLLSPRILHAVYESITTNQILKVAVSNASNYSYFMMNAGKIESKGIEATINAVPVKSKDFEWDVQLNWSLDRTSVLELIDSLPSFSKSQICQQFPIH